MRLALLAIVGLLLVAVPSVHAASTLHLRPVETATTEGPQKQIPTRIEVTNTGTQTVRVVFQTVQEPGGRWFLTTPDPVDLAPGQTETVVATISTPFHNGYVKDTGRFLMRAEPLLPGTQTSAGEPADIELGAAVKGWYVPGPSLPLALAALALAGLATRRLV